MKADFCSSILNGLSNVHMSESDRARAADRVRQSVAFVEWLFTLASSRRNVDPMKTA